MNQYDVIVMGGGASGMMAACSAAVQGARVLIVDKNDALGKKLSITGGGRCNITNAEFDIHALLSHYGSAKDFLFAPFSQFGVVDTMKFFKSIGIPIVVQGGKRAFPITERAADVVAGLVRLLQSLGVDVLHRSRISSIQLQDNRIQGICVSGGDVVSARNYVLAVGGSSRPETGSTGDGFDFLDYMGHTVHSPTPTIVPLLVDESWVSMFAGSTADVKVQFCLDGKKQFMSRGPILFTHQGVSGPVILNSSYRVAELLQAGPTTLRIDLYPEMHNDDVQAHILNIFDNNKNKLFKNVIKDVLRIGSAGAWARVFASLEYGPELLETKVHSITRSDRCFVANLAKSLPLTVTGLMGFDKAVIADGGVDLSEVDTRTMRSKKISNLFITGDLLHVNRPSGGYSLQLCWTTGHVAGKYAGSIKD